MVQIVCDSEKHKYYVYIYTLLAGSCLPAEITYSTQRALFHVCCVVFLVVLHILLLELLPGHPHPTPLRAPLMVPDGAKPPKRAREGEKGAELAEQRWDGDPELQAVLPVVGAAVL